MRSALGLFPLLLALLLLADVASAQGLLDRARRAVQRGAERAVEREATRRADRATTAAIGAVEDAVVCAFTDEACIENARQRGETVVLTGAEGNPVDATGRPVATAEAAVVPAAPGTGVWVNYDFVPGSRVLFAEDFAGDRVGDFPRRLEFVRGNWEIAEWQGRRLLRHTGPRHSAFRIPLPESLPERFTIEMEVHFTHGNQQLALLTQPPSDQVNNSGVDYNYFQIAGNGTGVISRERSLSTSSEPDDRLNEGLVPVRITVDGSYAKVYVGENRTANIPNAVLPRSEAIHIENTYNASEDSPIYVGPIRVAAGGADLYDVLETEGRVATQGIYFDTGSAFVRPESTPTLHEIARMLRDHQDLRLRIEGHTDDTGSAGANQVLSERRAEAVRAYLVGDGIGEGRLEAVGMGQSRPAVANDTPEARQQNRRVELVRL